MKIIIYAILLVIQWRTVSPVSIKDYCFNEKFEPQCSANEVIVMEKAIYGRMETSRCMTMDPSDKHFNDSTYFGCSSNVLDILDKKCSGLRNCIVRVDDAELLNKSSCYKELLQYLTVKYTCYQIIIPDNSCKVVVGSYPSHIVFTGSPELTSDNKCLSKGSTIFLEASHGQTINVSIIEFHKTISNIESKINSKKESYNSICNNGTSTSELLGTFRNLNSTYVERTSICSDGPKQRHIFLSKTNKIEFEIAHHNDNRFLLSFLATVSTCPDPQPGNLATILERRENNVTLKCIPTDQKWTLNCNGNGEWFGEQVECREKAAKDSIFKWNSGIIIVAVISLTLIVTLTITCLILYRIKRRRITRVYEERRLKTGTAEFVYKDGNQCHDVTDNRFSTTGHQQLDPPVVNIPAEVRNQFLSPISNEFFQPPYTEYRIYDPINGKRTQLYHTTPHQYRATFAKNKNIDGLPYSVDCSCSIMKQPFHRYDNKQNESPYRQMYRMCFPNMHQPYTFEPCFDNLPAIGIYCNDEAGPIYNTLEAYPPLESFESKLHLTDLPTTDLTIVRKMMTLSKEDIMAAEKAPWVDMM